MLLFRHIQIIEYTDCDCQKVGRKNRMYTRFFREIRISKRVLSNIVSVLTIKLSFHFSVGVVRAKPDIRQLVRYGPSTLSKISYNTIQWQHVIYAIVQTITHNSIVAWQYCSRHQSSWSVIHIKRQIVLPYRRKGYSINSQKWEEYTLYFYLFWKNTTFNGVQFYWSPFLGRFANKTIVKFTVLCWRQH